MTSALASLTATYTDSEGEDGNDDQKENGEFDVSTKSPSNSLSEKSNNSSRPHSPATIRVTTRVAKLVSYHDDTVASDDEGESEGVPHEVIVMVENNKLEENMANDDGVTIPPEPTGHCSIELQDKITKFYEKMQNEQLDMNSVIQKRKDFRNPSIYEKLIQFCDLNELGTNYPPAIYDPGKWTKESYYEELAKVQKTEMDKRVKDRKNKADLATIAKKNEDDKKRKSKWDQPGGGGSSSQPSNIKPAGLVQASLTTSSTGTKGTVISAFGSLPKKLRL
uniref:Putative SAP30-binding protein n=1 Tax=Leptinotarsa decemlineata TaxID=7539 RepID=A0A2D1QUE0_LEPDE|nr:SAP30-binding protein [Leptinotarsa decemlineata]ATP16147.1 putative SAP30-binding protein [Leptinotarsa decemlineata]